MCILTNWPVPGRAFGVPLASLKMDQQCGILSPQLILCSCQLEGASVFQLHTVKAAGLTKILCPPLCYSLD